MTDFATITKEVITKAMTESERSLFGKDKLGVSDIGHCREYARRLILDVPRDRPDGYTLPAFVGTAVGALLEREFQKHFPEALIQQEVVVQLTAYGYLLRIPGHPDLVLPKDFGNRIVDFKTADGLGVARREGPTLQQAFQLSLYAKRCIELGWLDENCTLTLCTVDRSGSDPDPVVVEWTYDPAIVAQAEEWLEDVIYAVVNQETAAKDPPRSWCWAVCEWAPSCRGEDTDVEGLIEDPIVLDAIKVYKEAGARLAAANKDRDSAKSVLETIEGRTADWVVRWVDVPGSTYEVNRQPYRKLDITPNRAKGAPGGRVRDGADVRGAAEVPATSQADQ